jgi:hypothetical protein
MPVLQTGCPADLSCQRIKLLCKKHLIFFCNDQLIFAYSGRAKEFKVEHRNFQFLKMRASLIIPSTYSSFSDTYCQQRNEIIAATPPRELQPMKQPRQPGLFDIEERAAQLTDMGDPLVGLKARIDWEAFRPDLNRVHDKDRKSNAGAKPIDVVLMFKVLVLQQLHNLPDDRTEYQIRNRLKDLNLVGVLFARFHEPLATQGYVARAGQMVEPPLLKCRGSG